MEIHSAEWGRLPQARSKNVRLHLCVTDPVKRRRTGNLVFDEVAGMRLQHKPNLFPCGEFQCPFCARRHMNDEDDTAVYARNHQRAAMLYRDDFSFKDIARAQCFRKFRGQ